MTCREKWELLHPGKDFKTDTINACPWQYGYLDPPEYCSYFRSDTCERCWDREIPEEPKEEKKLIYAHIGDPIAKVTDVVISDGGREVKMEPIIKDSGNRREFESGAVRDMQEGKGRMDLLPWAAIMEVSKHCENGAKKYGEHNVDKGLPTSSFCDSAARHLAKYLDGWTDEPHLLAAAWNLLWAIQMEIKHPEVVDTPWTKKEDTINMNLE